MNRLAIPQTGPRHGARRRRTAARPNTRAAGPVSISLWLPLTPLWILLAPFALLLAPALSLSREMRGVNPYKAAVSVGAVLFALSGTRVHVDAPGARIRLRIF
jgi:hypothetical protein